MCDLSTPCTNIQLRVISWSLFSLFHKCLLYAWKDEMFGSRLNWLFIHLRKPHTREPCKAWAIPFLLTNEKKKEKKEMNYQYTSYNLYNFCFIWHFLGWWYLKRFKKNPHNSCVKYDRVGVMGLKLLSGVCDHVNSTCNLTMATLLVMWRLLSASVTCSSLFRGFAACRQGSA